MEGLSQNKPTMRTTSQQRFQNTPWGLIPETMKTIAIAEYYKEFFPYEKIAAFLQAYVCTSKDFGTQSFALFSQSTSVLSRHARYPNVQEWKRDMIAKGAARVEIGPIYSSIEEKSEPDRAPLVFDLDIEDYAEVLLAPTMPTKETGLDEASWQHLHLSAMLLNFFMRHVVLSDDLNYASVPVFSGRRGIHLWILNRVRDWRSGDEMTHLLECINKLRTPAIAAEMVALLRENAYGHRLLTHIERLADLALDASSMLWNRLPPHSDLRSVAKQIAARPTLDGRQILGVMLVAPRVDREVTRNYKHLIKSPFSVHPRTGLISVPFRFCVDSPLTLAEVAYDVRALHTCPTPFFAPLHVLEEADDGEH